MEPITIEGPRFLKAVSVVRRFFDSTLFLPASDVVILVPGYFVVTTHWGGCFYSEPALNSLQEPISVTLEVLQRISISLEGREQSSVEIVHSEKEGELVLKVGRTRSASKLLEKVPMFFDPRELLLCGKVDVDQSFLKRVFDIRFGATSNPYKEEMLGVWYSIEDTSLYAMEASRTTKIKLEKGFETTENFFLPSAFIDRLMGIEGKVDSISETPGICVFHFSEAGVFPYIQRRALMMPPFPNAFLLRTAEVMDSSPSHMKILADKDVLSRYRRILRSGTEYPDLHVTLTEDKKLLHIEAVWRSFEIARGSFSDAAIVVEKSTDDIDFYIDAGEFLDACERFDNFYFHRGDRIYLDSTKDEKIEQLIAWKKY